ncbi:MAG: trypsin-like peptidase domain-containing protein, partial [Nitrospira sp.]|nr:trypsin-like peptidase domain-containing protein [Nitrospira sp.]
MRVRFKMAAPQNIYAFNLNVALAAAERWAKREYHHRQFEVASKTKRYSGLDTPERLAARANRLLRKLRDAAPLEAESISRDIAGAEVTAETASDELLERVIGKTRDFLFVDFLEKGLVASRSVGRVVTKLGNGRFSYGTGFMVSPKLLLTNHHVLPSAEEAGQSTIEFNYQRDRFGRDLTAQSFQLDPATFFLNDKILDFALVAVGPAGKSAALGQYLWCPLRPDAGKVIGGEPINIIQHPKGDRKQVVVRENRLIDSLDGADLFYHYEADTEPGSSGSPVFNDQWEVVAIHHSGVPKQNANGDFLDIDGGIWRKGDDPSRLNWVANEGVRISKLVQHIAGANVQGVEQKRLVRELLDAKAPDGGMESTVQPDRPLSSEPRNSDSPAHTVTVTVPIRIAVSLGEPECAFKILAQQLGKGMSGTMPVQNLSGPIVEHRLDPFDLGTRDLRKPCPFRK